MCLDQAIRDRRGGWLCGLPHETQREQELRSREGSLWLPKESHGGSAGFPRKACCQQGEQLAARGLPMMGLALCECLAVVSCHTTQERGSLCSLGATANPSPLGLGAPGCSIDPMHHSECVVQVQRERGLCVWGPCALAHYSPRWNGLRAQAIWLILPVVICFVQGLSHACLSVHGFPQWVCEWLLTSAVIYVIECGWQQSCQMPAWTSTKTLWLIHGCSSLLRHKSCQPPSCLDLAVDCAQSP